jgi:hypothetical protein
MARYSAVVESATGLTATAPVNAGTTNALFANILGGTTMPVKVRRIIPGVRAGTGAPTSQQVTVGIVRTTLRGTQTTNISFKPMDGANTGSSQSGGIDSAWSAGPTAASWASPMWEFTFNTQAALDEPWELLEELVIPPASGNANGLAFYNVGNALPTGHLYTMTFEIEE